MKIIRNFNIKKKFQCALSIGNFDGFHLGHQQLIRKLCIESNSRQLVSTVIIFEPQPKEFFLREKAPIRLSSLREKLRYFKEYGVQKVICVNFNKILSKIHANEFICNLLIKKLNIKYIIVGYDFKFGHNKKGDVQYLKKLGEILNFRVEILPKFKINKTIISSTTIRKILLENKLNQIIHYLGRPYSILGKIVNIKSSGEKFQFSIINIFLKKYKIPINGVYMIYILVENELKPGILNTRNYLKFNFNRKNNIELYIFDLNKNLYGLYIEIFIINKIREEIKFYSKKDLRKKILKDIYKTKQYFNLL